MSFSDSINTRSDKLVSLIWGCELSRQKDSYTFQMPKGWNCEEQLALCTICLGGTAQDEFHVVEVMAEQGDTQTRMPLATLKPSVLPMAMLAGVELTPPVTFHLRAGSGPVYISGQHLSMVNEEEEEKEEESPKKSPEESPKKSPEESPKKSPEESPKKSPEESPKKSPEESPKKSPEESPKKSPEESPKKSPEESPKKSPEESPKGQTTRKGNTAKKRRLEKEDDPNKADPEDPLPGKGRGAGRGRKAAPKK